MKKTSSIAAIFTLLLSGQLYAQDKLAACNSISSLAETIMKQRQNGAPMSEMMRIAGEAGGAIGKVGEELVIMAYDKPRYTTENYQQRVIEDFRDSAHLECVKQARR